MKLEKKSYKQLCRTLDEVFSLYIRLRDADTNGNVRCCTCGIIKNWKSMDCGHCISRNNKYLRWDEDNAAGQCKPCNAFYGGRQYQFLEYIRNMYGHETYCKLIQHEKDTKKWANYELIEKIEYFRKEVKNLKQVKGL